MIRVLLVSIFWLTGSVVNGSVQQNPSNLIKTERDSAELVCEHNIPSYTMIFWYKQTNGHELTLLGYSWNQNHFPEDNFSKKINLNGDGTKNGSLKINDLEPSDSLMYYCAASLGDANPAYFGNGTKLTVLDPSRKVSEKQDINVRIIKPSEKESCKKTVTLVCVARDFYPDHVNITWEVGGQLKFEGVATDPHATEDKTTKNFTISSRLKVPRKEWNNEKNKFKCTLSFFNGATYLSKEAEVNGNGGGGFSREDYVNTSQMIKLSYLVFIAKSALYGLVIFVYVWRKGSRK